MIFSSQQFHDLASGHANGIAASITRCGMWLASKGYGLAVGVRNRLYDWQWLAVTRARIPVISVGNLTAGGTGKTPCVEYLARFFRQRGHRVTILSRGYGTKNGPNDEALVLEENMVKVPHLQGADRVALAAEAIELLQAELLILDDGFQHRRLARDFDIVLIDASDPWGLGHLLPRGLLRETKRGLRRADAIIITRSDLANDIHGLHSEIRRRLRAEIPIVHSFHRPLEWKRHGGMSCEPTLFAKRVAGAFCGLGNPASFRKTLEGLGIEIADWRTFADHHVYSSTDIQDLRRWAETLPKDALVLTTQKDAVKLRITELAGRELWSLRIGLELQSSQERDELHRRLNEVMKT